MDINNKAQSWLELLTIMDKLRGENGCPWDKKQDHHSLKRYLLEESYEVFDAIEQNNDDLLAEELGDVLLQVVFHAHIAEEEGRFGIEDVIGHINRKMIRRHPHVFSDGRAQTAEQVLSEWELIKAKEKAKKHIMEVNTNLPSLLLAQKVQDKAARVGFDWPDIAGPWQKVAEEIEELKAAETAAQKQDELGDAIFALVNLARFMNVDAEDSLRHSVQKFIRRFDFIEAQLENEQIAWQDADLNKLDALWNKAKGQE